MDPKAHAAILTFLVMLGIILWVAFSDLHRSPPPPSFQAAQEKWHTRRVDDYDMEVDISCYCRWRPVLVTVRNGRVTDVQPVQVEDRDSVAALNLSNTGLTVDGLFARVAEAYGRSSEHIEVTYDSSYGYPVRANVDHSAEVMDDEWRMNVTLTVVRDDG
jgi:hypothetical protein